MLLQRLHEFGQRAPDDDTDADVVPPEYSFQPIPWIIHLNADGTQPSFTRTSGGQGKRDLGLRLCVPALRRSGSNVKPQLLADKAEFVLGVPTADAPQRAVNRHADFMALVEACAQATNDARVTAIAEFLTTLATQSIQLPDNLQPEEFVTFEVDGLRPVDLEVVRAFWAVVAPRVGHKGLARLTPQIVLSWLDQTDAGIVGQCIVCSEQKSIARVHPVAIKLPRSVSDQQLSIVTANKDAFSSYGLEQSMVAPTCRPCAASYASALNKLVRDQQHSLVIGSSIFVFWTREDVGFNPLALLTDPQGSDMRAVIESPLKGGGVPDVEDVAFYATVLSGSGGRAVVRDWIDTTIGNVRHNLKRWVAHQLIADEPGQPPRLLSLYGLAGATVRELKDVPTTTPRALLRSALVGTSLPMGLLYQAVRRNRAEQKVTRQRAALIKLVLLSQSPITQEHSMIQLDLENTNAAYRCGRLLAVLAEVQRQAQGKAVIVDRFFGTASAAPASVFGRLLRGAQPHFAKLERDKRGVAIRLQERLEEVMSGLTRFPHTLTLEEQALFALGFYHQRAYDRAQMHAAVERKRAAMPTTAIPTHMPLLDETDAADDSSL